jgi:excisionase family DNA binding protein
MPREHKGVELVVMTLEDSEAAIDRKLEPLRLELERLRSASAPALVPLLEAARRLGVTLRAVQRWARDGRLPVEIVGGVRMVRLPAGLSAGAVARDTRGPPQVVCCERCLTRG